MNTHTIIILLLFVAINVLAFFLMFLDKFKAIKRIRRISEQALFLWALFFGGIGIYLGMFAFRHKTQKWYFLFGIPLIIIGNLYLLYQIFTYLIK